MWGEKRNEFNTDPNAVLDERTHGWENKLQCHSEEARARTNKAIRKAIQKNQGRRSKRRNDNVGEKNSRNGQQL